MNMFMVSSSNGNIFALLALCARNSPVTGEFPSQRPVTRSFDVLLDLLLNKRLSKQPCGRWFETQSPSLWRHCNVTLVHDKSVHLHSNYYMTLLDTGTISSIWLHFPFVALLNLPEDISLLIYQFHPKNVTHSSFNDYYPFVCPCYHHCAPYQPWAVES